MSKFSGIEGYTHSGKYEEVIIKITDEDNELLSVSEFEKLLSNRNDREFSLEDKKDLAQFVDSLMKDNLCFFVWGGDIVFADGEISIPPPVKTEDKHNTIEPIQPMPKKAYIQAIFEILLIERQPVFEKSRQMMMSWIACIYLLWRGMYYPSSYFVTNKKKEDSHFLLERSGLVYYYLPEWIKKLHPKRKGSKGYASADCHIAFLNSAGNQISEIVGLSQDPDAIRTQTAACAVCDELRNHENLPEEMAAVGPAIADPVNPGQFIGISSPGDEYFKKMCEDIPLEA